ncbi:Apolipoprotein N-acyltransferase [Lacunisphaera limnophila]|uniref:Apolipoprotein N-acyltransferase n=1 Tax=Lacunisphaera limnophila TaxID=1838286 RepID=A0A1D8AR63_9BACT|nr:apolipoprotein N-acyltransferase [Lacunisphaera limnophila]AOS43377.1 Apolipoprotein N-acyltransferase [Lacunisphaera limnophila]
MTAPIDLSDPYAPRPTLWERYPQLAWGLAVFASTLLFTVVAFPPVNAGEAAYALVVPAVLWAYRRPSFRHFAWATLGSQVVAWTVLLGWLHHVTWAGLFMLGPFVGLLVGVWFLAAWWAVPRLAGHPVVVRVIVLLGLAGLWVMLEWLRSVLFGGFPWLPLAASQWQRPLVLQSASITGAWGVSFLLVFFGLGVAAYAHRIFFEGMTGLRKRSPEFMVALLLLIGGSFPFLTGLMGGQRVKLAKVALVQPYIPQTQKWDEAFASSVLATLDEVTVAANDRGAPDFILWPEAVTPWALYQDANVQDWLQQVTRKTGKPLLFGSVAAAMPGEDPDSWHNGAFVVDPVGGLSAKHYTKRKLVPFGEYIPLRPVLGWLEKVAPIGGDFTPGLSAAPLSLPGTTGRVPVGVLICYEDIFPNLARESVQAGAEVLAVLTNNAWFGEGGAAYQHAAHSVLRAVENRRPVIRVGNGGWSGWIDEYGTIRATLRSAADSVYFRGGQTVTVNRDLAWRGQQSFYTQHGDWFVLLCAAFTVGAYYVALTLRPPPPRPGGEKVF